MRPSGSGTTHPVTVRARIVLLGGVVCVLVPREFAIQEPVQVHLVEGGAELRSFSNCDGVLGAMLAVPALGRLGAVVLLNMTRCTIFTTMFRAVVPSRGMLGGSVLGLVSAVGPLSVFYVRVLVDDRHHVANGLGVALEHLPP